MNVVDEIIETVKLVVIAFMAVLIVGELYDLLPSGMMRLSFVSSIINLTANSLGLFFGTLLVVTHISALMILIVILKRLISADDGGAVAGA